MDIDIIEHLEHAYFYSIVRVPLYIHIYMYIV